MAATVQPVHALPRPSENGEADQDEDPFMIPPKAPVDALRKWRVSVWACPWWVTARIF